MFNRLRTYMSYNACTCELFAESVYSKKNNASPTSLSFIGHKHSRYQFVPALPTAHELIIR